MAAAWEFKTLVAAYADKTVKVWDIRDSTCITTLTFQHDVDNVATNGK